MYDVLLKLTQSDDTPSRTVQLDLPDGPPLTLEIPDETMPGIVEVYKFKSTFIPGATNVTANRSAVYIFEGLK